MDLKYLETKPGDVVLPPYGDEEDEYATLVAYEDGEFIIALDDVECTHIIIQEPQIDDLIEALKIVKENR